MLTRQLLDQAHAALETLLDEIHDGGMRHSERCDCDWCAAIKAAERVVKKLDQENA